jgi:hypothetical protein
MQIARSLALALAVIGVTTTASAQTTYGTAIGVIEVRDAPDPGTHGATYVNGGGFAVIPAGPVSLIPGLSLEYSTDIGSWGAVASGVCDVPLGKLPFGADVVALLLHDQLGSDFANAALYFGAGAGGTWFVDEKTTFSLAWNYYHGLTDSAVPHSQGPTMFIGRTF